jgi:hypothetical protein
VTFLFDPWGISDLFFHVMKTFLQKATVMFCLFGFLAALAVPAHAGRTGGSTFFIITTPKPVVSAF